MVEEVILVNAGNRALGRAEKFAAHAAGRLHRAFSIFLVDRAGRMLLQRRQLTKYHSGGLWANSCCGHPRPGERTLGAARRRLQEELGVAVPLRLGFVTRYRSAFTNGLAENEIVHVYFGVLPAAVRPDRTEIMAIARVTLAELRRDAAARPDDYAFWLKYYLQHHRRALGRGLAGAMRRAGPA